MTRTIPMYAIDDRRFVEQLREANQEVEERIRFRTQQLAETDERLRVLSAQNDRFLAVASRDLRNPLDVIETVASILSEDGDLGAAERRELLDRIGRTCRKMRDLLDGLLDVARLTGLLEMTTVEQASPARR
jgi:signal transduction histidine kinase